MQSGPFVHVSPLVVFMLQCRVEWWSQSGGERIGNRLYSKRKSVLCFFKELLKQFLDLSCPKLHKKMQLHITKEQNSFKPAKEK